jgi:hypothetical protein
MTMIATTTMIAMTMPPSYFLSAPRQAVGRK